MIHIIVALFCLLNLFLQRAHGWSNILPKIYKPSRETFSRIGQRDVKCALSFSSQGEYLSYLSSISTLPKGFSVGTTTFTFTPFEVSKILPMNLTLIRTDNPTSSFAALFTSNLCCGGPVIVGKERLKSSSHLQAIVINNKISNVCPGGVADGGAGDSDALCAAVANALRLGSKELVTLATLSYFL